MYLHVFTHFGPFILIFSKSALIYPGELIVFTVSSFEFLQVKLSWLPWPPIHPTSTIGTHHWRWSHGSLTWWNSKLETVKTIRFPKQTDADLLNIKIKVWVQC